MFLPGIFVVTREAAIPFPVGVLGMAISGPLSFLKASQVSFRVKVSPVAVKLIPSSPFESVVPEKALCTATLISVMVDGLTEGSLNNKFSLSASKSSATTLLFVSVFVFNINA